MWNQIKTTLLLGALTGLLLLIGAYFGGQSGLIIAFGLAILMNGISYFYSDKIVLRIYRAKEIKEHEHRKLHHIVEEIARRAGIPRPKLYLIPTDNANAFAAGRNPKHAAVAVTAGIMDLLTEEELKGVLSHELAHVKNRDILISCIAATIAGAISFLAFMARWAAIFGGFGSRDEGGHGFLELLMLAILAPIIALIIRLAISRSREYLADATGARIIKNPAGLASALQKLEASARTNPMRLGSGNSAHLFIVNPFRKSFLTSLFSTHPPVQQRVRKLHELKL